MQLTTQNLKDLWNTEIYNGIQIHDRFAYKILKKDQNPLGSIFSFVAPMEVIDNLIDLEDAMNQDYIYSDMAMNFIMEIPNKDLWGGVLFQRLLCAQVGALLCQMFNMEGYVDGDDIFIQVEDETFKKASVSIASVKNDAVLIHLGINIEAGPRAPHFAGSTHLSEKQQQAFIQSVENIFYDILSDVFCATTKIVS
jgi:hypothetical protein